MYVERGLAVQTEQLLPLRQGLVSAHSEVKQGLKEEPSDLGTSGIEQLLNREQMGIDCLTL